MTAPLRPRIYHITHVSNLPSSLTNAGAAYAEFRSSIDHLAHLDWRAVTSTDFRSEQVRVGKQAEFLVHEDFPWHLIQHIGAASPEVAQQAHAAISHATHQPAISVQRKWYH